MKRSVVALQVLIVGLALHNVVMALLWRAGVRGTALTVVSAWKDVLLLVALVLVVRERRRLPFDGRLTDWLALAFGALVVVYGLLPQSWLGGGATHRGVLYAARHDLLPVAAYFLGRGLQLTDRERARLCHTVLATAAFVAAFGLIDVYAVPLSFWRPAAGWFRDQLGLVYSAGRPDCRRTSSTTPERRRVPAADLDVPLAARDVLSALRRVVLHPDAAPLGAAARPADLRSALVDTHAFGATRARRRARPACDRAQAAAGAHLGGCGRSARVRFVQGYDHFGPRTHFTADELRVQEQIAHSHPRTSNDATSANESSTSEHLASLRDGGRTVLHHPWGFGLGNSGVTAARTHVAVKAGESTYTELGVETGVLGMLVFIAWSLALLRSTLRRRVWVGAAFAAVLLLGLQTDVIGVPWIAVTVWAFAGDSA